MIPRHLLPAVFGLLAAGALVSCKKPEPPTAETKPAEVRIPGASAKEEWTGDQLEFLQKKFGELTTLPSGLKFKVLQPGTGTETAPAGKKVTIHYEGRLLNDQLFDSSRLKGKPLEFRIGRGDVVKGFDEGVALMKKGEKRLIIIPYWLGYGPRYHGPLPPSSTLVFEVELLDWVDTKGIPMSQS